MDSGISPALCDQDYLSDIIPYRCPKCGDDRVFTSLRDLKRHLEADHAYKMGFVKPRTRAKVFSYSVDDSKPFPKDIANTRGWSTYSKDGPVRKKTEISTRYADNIDRKSPILDTFRDETKRLERRVQLAKETEMMNKLNRDIKDGDGSRYVHTDTKVGRSDVISRMTDVRSRLAAPDVSLTESIRSLNEEICKSRQHQWNTANNLYRSENVITGLEKAAEQRCHEQQGVIQELANSLKVKEDQLVKATKGLQELQRERQGLMQETKVLLDRSELSNDNLRSELSRRDGLIESTNEHLHNLQIQLRESLQERDGELARTQSRLEELEKEREVIREETQRLVSGVEMDNSVLKQTLDIKENQLRKVHFDLQKSRLDKENLVRESMNLYRTASEGNLKLRTVIEAKQSQLSDAQQQVLEIREAHELLLRESKQLTEQANTHRTALMQVLSDKEAQLAETRQQLQDMMPHRPEKGRDIPVHGEDNNIHTNDESQTHRDDTVLQEHMYDMQDKLQQKERELDALKQFISNTAEKEAIARQKLETFINRLINRADQAENELKQIKTQPGTSIEEDKGHRGQGHPKMKKKINTDRGSKKSKAVDGQNHSQSTNQGPELTSTPILAKRNEDRCRKHLSDSVANQVLDDVITPWNKSLPSSGYGEELARVLPPREFADNGEGDGIGDGTNNSMEDRDSIQHTETTEQDSEISDVVSLLNARQSDTSSLNDVHDKIRQNQGINNASHVRGQTDDTNSRKSEVPDCQSEISYADRQPAKISDNKLSTDDNKKVKKFLSKGKKKLKNLFNPGSKTPSPTARKSRPNKKSKDDINQRAPSTEHQDRKLRSYDFSPEHDSTSYSPLPDSLQHVYNVTASPVIHNAHKTKSNMLRNGTSNQPIKSKIEVPSIGKPFTDEETNAVMNGSIYHDRNMSQNESPEPSSIQYNKAERGRDQHSTITRNDPRSLTEIQPMSEDSYLNLPSHHDEIIFVPVSSKTGRVLKQIPADVYGNKLTHLHKDERSHHDSGTHATLEARDFRLEGKESSQVLPVVVLPSKPQVGVNLPTASSSDSMYDESSVHVCHDLEDGHSLCDVGSILEDEPASEELQSTLDEEMDKDGIIWVREDRDVPVMYLDNQERFGPYGSEMRSRSSNSVPETDNVLHDCIDVSLPPYHSYDSEAMPDTYPRMQSNHVHFKDDPRSDPSGYDKKHFPQKYNFRNKHNVGTWMSPAVNTNDQSSETYSKLGSEDSVSSKTMNKSYPLYKVSESHHQKTREMRSKSMLDLNKEFHQNLSGDGVLYTDPDKHEKDRTSVQNRRLSKRADSPSNYYSYNDFQSGLRNSQEFSTRMDFSIYDEMLPAKSRSALNLRVRPEDDSNTNIPRSVSAQAYNTKSGPPSNNKRKIIDFKRHVHEKRDTTNRRLELERRMFADNVKRKLEEINQRAGMQSQSMNNLGDTGVLHNYRQNMHRTYDVNDKDDVNDRVRHRLMPYGGDVWDRSRSLTDLHHHRQMDKHHPMYKDAHSQSMTFSGKNVNHGSQTSKPEMKDSSSQTFLLDRRLSGKSVEDLEQISSTVSQNDIETHKHWNDSQKSERFSHSLLSSNSSNNNSIQSTSSKDLNWSKPETISAKLISTVNKEKCHPVPAARSKSPKILLNIEPTNHNSGRFEIANQKSRLKEMSVTEYKEVDTVSDHSIGNIPSGSESHSAANENGNESFKISSHKDDHKLSASNENGNESFKISSHRDDHKSTSMTMPCTFKVGMNVSKVGEQNLEVSAIEIQRKEKELIRDVSRNGHQSQTEEISLNESADNTIASDRIISDKMASESSNAAIASIEEDLKEELCSPSKEMGSFKEYDEDSVDKSSQNKDMPNKEFTNHEHNTETVNDTIDEEFDIMIKKESLPSDAAACKSDQDSESGSCLLSDSCSEIDSYCYQSYKHLDEDFYEQEESLNSESVEHMDLRWRTSSDIVQKSPTMQSEEASDVREPDSADSCLMETTRNGNEKIMLEDENENIDVKNITNEYNALSEDLKINTDHSVNDDISNSSVPQSQRTEYELHENPSELEFSESSKDLNFRNDEPHPLLPRNKSLDEEAPPIFERNESLDEEPRPFFDRNESLGGLFAEVQETDEDSVSVTDDFRSRLTPASSLESLIENRPKSKHAERRKRRIVLHNIFRFLDVETLLQVALVCREWKHVSRHPDLWKQVRITGQKCSSQFLINLSRWCTKTQLLSLIDLKSRDKLASETDDEYIASIRGSLEPGLERFLQVTESTLRSVEIVNCGYLLTDKSIWLASCYCRLLHSVTYVTNTSPLGPDVMWAFGAGCRTVTSLVIPPLYPCKNSGRFNNKCLQTISQCCVDLEALSIGGPNIDINGLVLIAKSCQRLRRFELHHTNTIDEDTAVALCRLGLQNITHLSFIHTTVTPSALMHFYENCRHLFSLVVAMSISDFNNHREDVELEEIEKWCLFVQEMKELEAVPRLDNIIKINLQSV